MTVVSTRETIHVGDVGTEFLQTVTDEGTGTVVDLSSATDLVYYFKKPDCGTVFSRTAAFKTDGTDGQLTYLTIVGDLDQAGTWVYQAEFKLNGTDTRRTEQVQFEVQPIIELED